MQQEKLLIPVYSDRTDIGALFSLLPPDVAALQNLNATELPESQYQAAIDKVHGFIEEKARELSDGALVQQQERMISTAWAQHFKPHLDNSSVIILTVTSGGLGQLQAHPEKSDLVSSTKMLLEWQHALAQNSERDTGSAFRQSIFSTGDGESHSKKPAVVVVPLFLCGHEGDVDADDIDFSAFNSVNSLVNHFCAESSGGGASLDRTGSTWASSGFDSADFWQTFPAHRLPEAAGGAQLLPPLTIREIVRQVFELARQTGLLVNLKERSIARANARGPSPVQSVGGSIYASFVGAPQPADSAPLQMFLPDEQELNAHITNTLQAMYDEVSEKEHVVFVRNLAGIGQRIPCIHELLVREALSRSDSLEEVFLDERYNCLTRDTREITTRPLEDCATRTNRSLLFGWLLYPPGCVLAAYFCTMLIVDTKAFNEYEIEQLAAGYISPHKTAGINVVLYGAFIIVLALGFMFVLYPLLIINFIFFKLDSKLTTALCRRFLCVPFRQQL